jgi:hypothetical protein
MLPLLVEFLWIIVIVLIFIMVSSPWQVMQYNLEINYGDDTREYTCSQVGNNPAKCCPKVNEYIAKPEKFKHFEPDEAEKEASNSYKSVPYVPKKYNVQTLIPTRMIR